MDAYVDSSVLLRVVLGESDRLQAWGRITRPVASELILPECLRTIDRARLRLGLGDAEVARLRAASMRSIERFFLVRLDRAVLERAADPFPTLLGTLDAIHLASAMLVRPRFDGLRFATHDRELVTAAAAMGFEALE